MNRIAALVVQKDEIVLGEEPVNAAVEVPPIGALWHRHERDGIEVWMEGPKPFEDSLGPPLALELLVNLRVASPMAASAEKATCSRIFLICKQANSASADSSPVLSFPVVTPLIKRSRRLTCSIHEQ